MPDSIGTPILVGKEKMRKKNVFGSHYSWLLCSIKLPRWTGKYRTIASRKNTGFISWEPLVTPFSSTNQYMILFSVCFCLKTLYLISMVTSLTLNGSQLLMPEGSLSNIYFLNKAHHSLLTLRNYRRHFNTLLGGHFNSDKKTTKMKKTWHPVNHKKDVCLQYENRN